ncbi:MAG: PucC family protein, partial [Bacteroidota bacterium]
RPTFSQAWATYRRDKRSFRLLVAVALGTAGFSMQDVLLEPYGGEILNLSVSQTTLLNAVLAGGTLIGFGIAARILSSRKDPYRLAAYGSLIGVVAFSLVIFAAPFDSALLFRIGTGFIGMEAAAALIGRGLSVTVVGIEAVPFEHTLGPDVGAVFQRLHEEKGVAFRMGASTEQISATDDGLRLTLGDGTTLDADLIVMGVGVTPATGFLESLPKDQRGALMADENLRVGPDLYAAGDIASYPEARLGQRVRIEHWRLAQQHGRIAARNMAGQAVPFEAVPYFWSGQLGINLRYLGHAKSWDEVIIDGSLDDRQFVAYYAKDGRVQAAAGVKRDKVIASLHAHWMTGGTTSVDEVRG